jgi:preprotein translocase subunit SecG
MANIFSSAPPPPTSNGQVKAGRFGRNGTRGYSIGSLNGNGQSAVPRTWVGRLGHYWDTYAPFRNPFAKKPDVLDDDTDVGNGVHAITKKTDYWFNRELYQLEEEAKKLAADWAEKGLPRHDVARTGVFEPEQVLGMKSLELFRQWHRRVRVKMQDHIQNASASLNKLIGESRAEVNALDATSNERKNTRTQIESFRQFKEPDGVRVGYDRILKNSWGFWIFAAILTVAEFTANFPVFRLLLPMNSTLVTLAATLGEAAESHTWLAGPLVLLQDILLHFEAFLVALIAVVILVFLGKTAGASARAIVSFSESEAPMAATTIRAHRRQHTFVFVAGVLGIASVLSFMYFARAQIAETAQSRVRSDSVSLRQALSDQQAAGTDLAKAPAATQRVKDATRTLQQHLDDSAYAQTVQRINNAIVWLNIGLVLAAMTLGFVYKREDLTDRQGEHPALKPLRKRMLALEREALGHAHAARIAMSNAATEAGRINHLLESHPLREWQAKQDRLQGIIPLFRGENARVRGLDPMNVFAFNQPGTIVFPEVNENEELRRPTELDQLLRQLDEVEAEFVRVAAYAVPTNAPSST